MNSPESDVEGVKTGKNVLEEVKIGPSTPKCSRNLQDIFSSCPYSIEKGGKRT
jgi:hypothetical protein